MEDPSKPNDSQSREPTADPTIVGGRPPGRGRARVQIPQGIEVLLKKASVDPEFRRILIEKRAAAAAEIGLELSAAEIAMLNAVPQAQIEQIIKNTTVPNEQRRVFLGQVGAAMLAMIGVGLSFPSCVTGNRVVDLNRVQGIRPDVPPPRPLSTLRVSPENERLKVHIVDKGEKSLTINLTYDCPFADGVLKIIFFDKDMRRVQVATQPERHLTSDVKANIAFSAEGTSGTTDWIIAQLGSISKDCPGTYDYKASLSDFDPGEYRDACVIWRVEAFHKVWGA